MVTLIVGKKKEKFYVPKGLLESKSRFFKAAFDGPFNEATTQVMEMPEDGPDSVKRFVLWLYTGSFYLKGSHFDVLLYCFAEQIDCLSLRNDLIRSLAKRRIAMHELKNIESKRSILECYFSPQATRKIWESTRKSSKIRLLILDIFAYAIESDFLVSMESERGAYSADVMTALSVHVLQKRESFQLLSHVPGLSIIKDNLFDGYYDEAEEPASAGIMASGGKNTHADPSVGNSGQGSSDEQAEDETPNSIPDAVALATRQTRSHRSLG